jgi:two-component system, OmpR family, sensor kinase
MKGTIGRQVTALALVSMIGILLISFGFALLTPAPAPHRMTVEEAAAALRGSSGGLRSLISVSERPGPPGGRESELVASAVAGLLHVDPASVQATWADDKSAPAVAARGESVVTIGGKDAVVDVVNGGFVLRWGGKAKVGTATPLPPFSAAVRQPDGRWLAATPREPPLSAWRLEMLTAFLLSAALVAPLAWLVGRRITQPIRALADAAARAQLDNAARAPEVGPAEVRAAAAAINAMRDRLAADAAERTRMLAAVAHDLRNPLTGIRLRAESSEEPTRGRIIADVDRMESMINQVLDYVRGRELEEPRRMVDPAEWLRACAEDAVERGEDVRVAEALAHLKVNVGPDGLRRALTNLIDNAVRYGHRATLSLSREGDTAIFRIADGGPGIEDPEISRLVEPFQRLEQSRSRDTGGAGLGLAIANDFAKRHGGSLRLSNRPEGGLLAELQLPIHRGNFSVRGA